MLVSVAFVAVLSVAFVALVRKDAYDHAIWTVVVFSHPVVTHHHSRHSLELVSVEAPVIEIVVVIAHAIHFLVVIQANLAVQEAPEVCQEDQEEHQDREFLAVMESWSHLSSFVFGCNQLELPESSFQNTTIVHSRVSNMRC